jgi:hypothetical protein
MPSFLLCFFYISLYDALQFQAWTIPHLAFSVIQWFCSPYQEAPLSRWLIVSTLFVLGFLLNLSQKPLLKTYLRWNLEREIADFNSRSPETMITAEQEKLKPMAEELKKVAFFNLGSAGLKDAAHVLSREWIPALRESQQISHSTWTQLATAQWQKVSITSEDKSDDWSWLSQLQQFDHWNFDSGIMQGHYSKNPLQWPVQSHDWLALARWRLLASQTEDSPLPALEQVRHLAFLLYTTDDIRGVQLALDILQSETDFLANKKPALDASLWRPISTDHLQMARDFFEWQHRLYDVRNSNESFLLFFTHPVGQCLRVRATLKKFIELKRVPRAATLWSSGFDRINQSIQLTQLGCRKDLLRQVWGWENNPFPPLALIDRDSLSFWQSYVLKQLGSKEISQDPDLHLALVLYLINDN